MENKVIKIHEDNLALFNEKLADLNKKFAKKGLPLINCEMTSELIEEKLSDAEVSYLFCGQYHPWAEYRRYTLYTATLSSDFDNTNLKGIDCEFEGVVTLVEKAEADKIYTFKNINYSHLLKDCKCDECGKKISRAKYLVFSKVGKEVETRDDLIVLGTSCSKNYFPFSIESYFGYLESAFSELGNYDEYNGSFGGCISHYHTLHEIYTATLCTTDNLKVYEKEGVTKGNVFGWMNNDKIGKYERYREVYRMPQNPIPFEDAISWIDEIFNKDDVHNDFEMNCRTAFYKTLDDGTRELRHELHERFIGIAIYGFISAKNNHEKLVAKKVAEENRAKENATVEYFGAIGDKFELTLTFDKIFGFETQYGYSYILLFHDDENHRFKWSSSNGNYKVEYAKDVENLAYGSGVEYCDYEVGHKYLIKGSIKAHDEYKGCKQTVITRCKVLDDFINRKVDIHENMRGENVAKIVDSNYVDPFDTLINTMEEVEQSA